MERYFHNFISAHIPARWGRTFINIFVCFYQLVVVTMVKLLRNRSYTTWYVCVWVRVIGSLVCDCGCQCLCCFRCTCFYCSLLITPTSSVFLPYNYLYIKQSPFSTRTLTTEMFQRIVVRSFIGRFAACIHFHHFF